MVAAGLKELVVVVVQTFDDGNDSKGGSNDRGGSGRRDMIYWALTIGASGYWKCVGGGNGGGSAIIAAVQEFSIIFVLINLLSNIVDSRSNSYNKNLILTIS